jgi:hypothetical protein
VIHTGSNHIFGELLVNIKATSGWRRHNNNINNLQMATIEIKCFHNIL